MALTAGDRTRPRFFRLRCIDRHHRTRGGGVRVDSAGLARMVDRCADLSSPNGWTHRSRCRTLPIGRVGERGAVWCVR